MTGIGNENLVTEVVIKLGAGRTPDAFTYGGVGDEDDIGKRLIFLHLLRCWSKELNSYRVPASPERLDRGLDVGELHSGLGMGDLNVKHHFVKGVG